MPWRRGRVHSQPRHAGVVTLRGAEPVGSEEIGAIDQNYGLSLAGVGTGHVPIGMPAVGVNKFSGECGPVQNFGRGRFMGAAASWKGSLNEEQSPGNPGPSTLANPVLRSMLTNGVGL